MEDYEVVDIANLGAENNYCQIQKECIDPSCVFCLEKKIAPSSPNTKKNEDSPNYKSIPEYKIIPNTDFIVDGFKYKTSACKNYFLSHFHSDHYTGLGKSFKEGTIYCSQITSRLIISELKVNPQFVVPIEMYKKHIVGGAEVILIDANHCPGAVCFLFKIGGKYYLHTGDFRFDRSAAHWQMLSTIPIEGLYLDNTFCSPRYIFPSQKDAIDEILSIAKQADALDTLFLVGSYTIGKERVYLSLAKSLNRKVLVTPQKYRILACLDLDMSLFTLNSTETNIHVLAMGQLSFKNLKELLLSYNGQYQRIVAFQPTGWAFGKELTKTAKRIQDSICIYGVPYSEHSNFNELKEFVNWVNPKQLIPTVDFSSGKAQEVSELLFAKEKEEKRTAFSQFTSAITNIKQFITSCFTKQETISISEEGSSFQTQHDEAGEKGEDFDLEIIDPVLLNQQRWLLSQFEKNKPTITQTTTPTTSKKRSKNETETPRTTKKVKLNTAPTSGKFKQQSVLDFFCK